MENIAHDPPQTTDNLKTQNTKRGLVFLEVGLFEITFVVFVLVILFGILNYFNILSLSKLYPKTFGWFPHRPFNVQKVNTAGSSLSSPTPINYAESRLSAQKIEEAKKYVKEKNFASKTLVEQDRKSFAVDGIFSAFKKQQIQLVTADGIMNFTFNSSTVFEQMSLAKTDKESQNTGFSLSKTYTADTFLQNVPLGKFVQVYFTDYGNSNLSASRIIYYPDLK